MNLSPLNDSVVPIDDVTRLVTSTSKGARVVGIERKLPQQDPVPPKALQNMWKTPDPIDSFLSMTGVVNTDRKRYSRINAVEMLWGLIPVEYELEQVRVRKVFHVLITVPAPGFNLAHFVREHFFNERNRDKKDMCVRNEVSRCPLMRLGFY